MNTVQIRDTAPIASVETSGVRWRALTCPTAFGIAPNRAIERVVLAVGRIVVCVEADAEVSTAMISSLSHGDPKTLPPRALRTSVLLLLRKAVPAYATAAAETTT